jgi:peptide/nickel transport system substrate-binding protein
MNKASIGRRGVLAAGALAAGTMGAPGITGAQAARTLRFIPHTNLFALDPITTTAYVVRNHGYLIYDTLYGMSSSGRVVPQMVEGHELSADGLTCRFRLREGLRFHDNEPVRPADVFASLRRWAARDAFGQNWITAIADMTAQSDRDFTLHLRRRYPQLIEALGKLSNMVPFIMPERIARTDPFQNITEPLGSGPFRWRREEFVAGSRMVYERWPGYVSRNQAPDWNGGGKPVMMDRVEWTIQPDASTAAAAVQTGEVDWWEWASADLLPVLERNRGVQVATLPLEALAFIRFNTLVAPFNNPLARRAVMWAVQQEDFMRAQVGLPALFRRCASVFTCGAPMSSEAGAEALTGARDLDRARAMLREAGYNGERIVVLSASDIPSIHNQSLITNDLLRRLGMNVDFAVSDWGTLVARRNSREPTERGGWNLMNSWNVQADLNTPAVSNFLRGNGTAGVWGWLDDATLEQQRDAWFAAETEADQRQIAEQMQRRAMETVPFVPVGQFNLPSAWRRNLEGVPVSPVPFFWGIRRT